MAREMVELNRSLPVDRRLWEQDVRGSRAWAQALTRAGVLSAEEGEGILAGLRRVAERLPLEDLSAAEDEDVHSLVERLLKQEIGELAGKLHTGRSRNDQVATDLRLWGMEAGVLLQDALNSVIEGLLDLGGKGMERIIPGYTHLQQAQPLRASHWALSHAWPLLRDRERMRRAAESAAVLPLGSGALAGCPYPIDREELRAALGFREISRNSLDAVADRDWVAEMAFAGALVGVHLSRLGEDLVLFSTREFGLLEISDAYSTGSSLLPQKRNPDVAELTRGKAGRLVGNLTGLLTLLKGLPSGYNRDLQEDKELLFDTVDTLLLVLPAMAGALSSARFRGEEKEASPTMTGELLATDLADYLVRRGVPFRRAHEVVGQAVRAAEDAGVPLAQLPLDAFRALHPGFAPDLLEVFSWEASVEARAVPGGTAREAVQAQMDQLREALRR